MSLFSFDESEYNNYQTFLIGTSDYRRSYREQRSFDITSDRISQSESPSDIFQKILNDIINFIKRYKNVAIEIIENFFDITINFFFELFNKLFNRR